MSVAWVTCSHCDAEPKIPANHVTICGVDRFSFTCPACGHTNLKTERHYQMAYVLAAGARVLQPTNEAIWAELDEAAS